MNAENAVDLATTHVHAFGHLVRMAQFHLLDPHYDEHHRGRLTAEGEVLPVLRVRTHDRFLEEMRYDERYTPLLQRAGLDVVSYQVRRGLPTFNPAALMALVDMWRPETHTFHLPCGEMTVTLEDCQKILGLIIIGRPVTGQASPGGWRQRVEAFLGRLLPDDLRGSHNTGVPLTWLRQTFGQCPPGANEQTDTTGGYSWASVVLAFLYRVARQFGLRQEFPVEPFSTSIELHKFDRQRQKKVMDFETHHRDYIDEWEQQGDLNYENDQAHTNYNFRRGYHVVFVVQRLGVDAGL
ncbi:protein MAINTENANCE OF MERISTEMS-like [Zea mays]|uniref:protein MAINTENANCE OF MERISTEMS-like n=1 Tax=Zea mays TaxID=4577 RepID=UPI001651F993|nr:protein MAINTENANCE OF MERISTEMS-like [Zea mays]